MWFTEFTHFHVGSISDNGLCCCGGIRKQRLPRPALFSGKEENMAMFGLQKWSNNLLNRLQVLAATRAKVSMCQSRQFKKKGKGNRKRCQQREGRGRERTNVQAAHTCSHMRERSLVCQESGQKTCDEAWDHVALVWGVSPGRFLRELARTVANSMCCQNGCPSCWISPSANVFARS